MHRLVMLLADAQARAAVSQASIDELAAEINAETSAEPKIPDEVRHDRPGTVLAWTVSLSIMQCPVVGHIQLMQPTQSR